LTLIQRWTGHPTQFKAFFTALAAGKEMSLTSTSFAATTHTHEVMFAADKSADTDHPIKQGSKNESSLISTGTRWITYR